MMCKFDHGQSPNEMFLSRDSNILSQQDVWSNANDIFVEGHE